MTLLQHARIVELSPEAAADVDLVKHELPNFMLSALQRFYPAFEDWYRRKVIPSFLARRRTIFIASGEGIEGVSIVKHPVTTASHAKLTSFFVARVARGRGLGTRLLDQTCSFLDSQRFSSTIVTVPEEAFEGTEGSRFVALLGQAGFRVISTALGRYRLGKVEYVLERHGRVLG